MREDCKECTPDQPCKKHWQRKRGESESDYDNRKTLYELTGIRDESMHIKPYADMIDKLTYVQKADFAKHAQLLQSWIHDHGPHNESIIFVQKYWNKENIFPYEI
jgi:hypothetical protein